MSHIRDILNFLAELLYPRSVSCHMCKVNFPDEGHEICPSCLSEFTHMTGPVCACCGGMADFWDEDEVCSRCAGAKFSFERARSAFAFDGGAARAIHALKFGGSPFLCGDFAEAMLPIVAKLGPDIIVPVPLHPRRQKKRGYNQAEKLCEAIAELLNLTGNGIIKLDALVRNVNTAPQARLSAKKRAKQMSGEVFALSVPKARISGKRVALIDDVFTTGATCEACARVLIEAGAKEVFVVTACMAGKGRVRI